jgi:hypothetical protein
LATASSFETRSMTLLLKSQAAPAFPKPPPVVSPAGIWS